LYQDLIDKLGGGAAQVQAPRNAKRKEKRGREGGRERVCVVSGTN